MTPEEGAGRSVLVVDDEEALLRVHARILAKVGYRVVTTADGEAAEHALREGSFDVILSDVDIVATGLEGYLFHRNHRSPGTHPYKPPDPDEERFPWTTLAHCWRLPPRTAPRGAGAVKRAAPFRACAAKRAPPSARRRTVPKSPGGLLDTGEPGGISGPRLRWRQSTCRN